MNIEKSARSESNTWLMWTAATALGLLISDGIGFVVNTLIPVPICALLDILASGMIIAALQWFFVLRSHVAKSHQWIWCSTAGWATGWVLGNPFGALAFLALLIHGTLLGFSQWFFFLRRFYPSSFSWIAVNAFGLPLAFVLSWELIFPVLLGGYNGALSGPADSIIRGVLFGAITGGLLIRLRSQPQKEMDSVFSNAE
jgi:hypothetical protein